MSSGTYQESQRRQLAIGLPRDYHREAATQIKSFLDTALRLDPSFGPALLLAAEFALCQDGGANLEAARDYASRARGLLGDAPKVLLILGRALLGLGRAPEALGIRGRVPETSPERSQSRRDCCLGQREARVESAAVDVAAHMELGRWRFRRMEIGRARGLFARVAAACPLRAEGHYGLAQAAFLDGRLAEAHRLCQVAVRLNPMFGLAYELLGCIFENLRVAPAQEVAFPREDPVPYFRRAVELDSTCDTTMWLLAEHHLRRGALKPAIELLEHAAASDTTLATVYLILATIYQGTRQFARVPETYSKAKELAPGRELTVELKNEILRLCGYEY